MTCENCGEVVPEGKVHETLDPGMCIQTTPPRPIRIKRSPSYARLTLRR